MIVTIILRRATLGSHTKYSRTSSIPLSGTLNLNQIFRLLASNCFMTLNSRPHRVTLMTIRKRTTRKYPLFRTTLLTNRNRVRFLKYHRNVIGRRLVGVTSTMGRGFILVLFFSLGVLLRRKQRLYRNLPSLPFCNSIRGFTTYGHFYGRGTIYFTRPHFIFTNFDNDHHE